MGTRQVTQEHGKRHGKNPKRSHSSNLVHERGESEDNDYQPRPTLLHKCLKRPKKTHIQIKIPNTPGTECQKFWTRKTQIHLMEPRKQKHENQ